VTEHPLIRAVEQGSTKDRATLLANVRRLADEAGLAVALRALFRQQVRSGFVLFDPGAGGEHRVLEDEVDDARFVVQWNPERRLRLDHDILMERGIVCPTDVPLINPDARGVPCYLCRHNIEHQNPAEVLLGLELGSIPFYLGANFAPIGAHHFTVMSAEHEPQRYQRGLLEAALDLIDRTNGEFRVLYNGRAGASIEAHLHLHATTTELPVEAATSDDHIELSKVALRRPAYPTPLWLLESASAAALIETGDEMLRRWHALDPEHHSENLLITRTAGEYRLFIYPRDRRRRTAPGRRGALASFELSGLIAIPRVEDRAVFESVRAADMRALIGGVAPERDLDWP